MSDPTNQEPSGFSAAVPVYERLGNIIRALHDTLRELGAQDVLSEAASEFPSARERLIHIASLTERAANTVLSKVEETNPLQQRISEAADALALQWNKVNPEDLPTEEMRKLGDQTRAFIASAQSGSSATYQALTDIMMSQDFQDLTGQLIKKVVTLIERTENELLALLIDAAPAGAIPVTKKEELLAGPGAVGGVLLDQGNVDDLLADLGF